MEPIDQQIVQLLTAYLGPHTAKTAVKTFSARAIGVTPNKLTPKDVPKLLDAMRPMLRTLLGENSAEALVATIQKAFA